MLRAFLARWFAGDRSCCTVC